MKKTLSIAAVTLFVAGSTAYACGSSCGKDKDTSKPGASYNAEQSQLACGGSKKGDDSKKTA